MKKNMILALTGLVVATQSIFAFADTSNEINTNTISNAETLAIPTLYQTTSASDEITSATMKDALDQFKVMYLEKAIELNEPVKWIDGVLMVPVKPIMDQMGYETKWNGEKQSVDFIKGAQFTSIYIGQNQYFKNKMAPHELSHAPVINQNRTYVPLEFFTDILGIGLSVEDKTIQFSDREMAIHEGYIQDVKVSEKGVLTITISSKENSEGLEDQVIVHGEEGYSIINSSIAIGDYIHVISPPIMTLSLPGQASAYVIY